MLAALLLQASRFLAPLPELPAEDAAYAAQVDEWLGLESVTQEVLLAGSPASPQQAAVVVALLRDGGPREVRLGALLASGSDDPALAGACARAACETREASAALAALLAPTRPRPGDLPALATLALQSDRPLEVRAAALGRLLESGSLGSWPVARSVLRAGTHVDEDAPWSDWPRTGRYELPKRTLLVSVDAVLAAHGAPGSGCEPNASWREQQRQLAALEPRIVTALRADPQGLAASVSEDAAFRAGCVELLRAAGLGDERASRALGLLAPASTPVLEAALAGAEPALVEPARAALARTPS